MSDFNLVDEPWVLVQRQDGPGAVSLREAFAQAHDIVRLTGDVPTQAFANLRLLLAIAQDALGVHDLDRLDEMRLEGLDGAAIDAYLAAWHDRFWLFDGARPFMQVAGLRRAKGEASGLEKIIADVPNGLPFFTTRSGPALASIPPAEAARWLVHAQAFDPSGIRSGAFDDPLVKGGRGYPIGPAWAGQLGGMIVHGSSLAETLALNLVVTPDHPADRPVWTLPEPHTSRRQEEAVPPPGPVSLLVWQSRRVRLIGGADAVTGVVLCQGDRMAPQNRHDVEPMSLWRFSEPQTKKFGRETFMPAKHSADRALWRTLPTIMGADRSVNGDTFRLPLTVKSLEDMPELAGTYELQAIGIVYGGNEATIDEIVVDSLDLRASMLRRESRQMRAMLADAVSATEDAVRELGKMAANIAKAAGERGEAAGDGARSRAIQSAWSLLDQPAREWIGGLEANQDAHEAHRTWQVRVAGLLNELADDLYRAAPRASIKGRVIRAGIQDRFVTADVARMWFGTSLRKALPLAHPTRTKESA